jgi:hypothetical protein
MVYLTEHEISVEMKKALVVLVFVMLTTALLLVSALAQTEGKKIRLVTREISLGKVHTGGGGPL